MKPGPPSRVPRNSRRTTADFSERFAAAHGQWIVALLRGELSSARKLAFAMLAGSGRRWTQRRKPASRVPTSARSTTSRRVSRGAEPMRAGALGLRPRGRREARERFGDDIGAVVMSFLAITTGNLASWIARGNSLRHRKRRATELDHATSMATAALLEFHPRVVAGRRQPRRCKRLRPWKLLRRDHGMIALPHRG